MQYEQVINDGLIILPRDPDASSNNCRRAFQKRRRSRACDACRMRKTKCDTSNAGPCSSCIAASLLCRFSSDSDDKRKVGPARRLRQLESTVRELSEKLEQAEAKLHIKEESLSPTQSESAFNFLGPSSTTLQNSPTVTPTTTRGGNFDSPAIQKTLSRSNLFERRQSAGTIPIPKGRAERPYLNEDAHTLSFFGPTSGLAFISSIQDFVEGLGYDASKLPTWTNTEALATPAPPPAFGIDTRVTDLRVLLPPRDVADRLIEIYRCTIQKYMASFYWPTIISKFRRAYENPILITEEKAVSGLFCVVMMIMATACLWSDDEDVVDRSRDIHRRGWDYYDCAKRYHDLNKPRFTVDDATVLLLMTLYLDGTDLPSPSWMVVGSLARVCQDIGLHRKPAPNRYTLIEAEHQCRIFWSTFLLDRKLAVQFGRPPMLNEDEIEVDMPGCSDYRGVENAFISDKDDGSIPLGLTLMRSCIENAKTNTTILRMNVNPGDEDEALAKLEFLGSQMDDMAHRFPKNILDPNNNEALEPAVVKFLLLPLASRLCLYRFFSEKSLRSEFRCHCLMKSIEAAKHTVNILQRMMRWPNWTKDFRPQQSQMVYYHIFRSAIILLLGHQLAEAPPGFVAASNISTCTQILEQAAQGNALVGRCLQLFEAIADALHFRSDANIMSLSNTSASEGSSRQSSRSSNTMMDMDPSMGNNSGNYGKANYSENPTNARVHLAGDSFSRSLPQTPLGIIIDPRLTFVDDMKVWTSLDFSGLNAGGLSGYSTPSAGGGNWTANLDFMKWGVVENALAVNSLSRDVRDSRYS